MKNSIGWTPMHYACRFGNNKMVKLLAKTLPYFDTTLRTDKGFTIFHLAVCNLDLKVPKLILNTFRFKDIKDEFGKTMIHHAIVKGSKRLIQSLLESRKEIEFNLEERTNKGLTILHLACGHRDIEIIDLVFSPLVEMSSDIDFDTQAFEQLTPIHYACRQGHLALIKYLFKKKTLNIDFNVMSKNGS